MDAQLLRFYLASVLSTAIPGVVAAQGSQAGFRETEIVIQSDGIDLAGTLTLPTGPGTHPAVVLIPAASGSGRDVCSGAFCSFREIAHGLASRGIAVVRYDERGSGSSGGEHVWQYTVQDYARDADAAVDYLAKRPEIDPERVGVIGHSLGGGVVAPLAYLGNSSISFVVSLSGEGLSFADVRLGYLRELGEANGKSEPEISEAIRFEREVVHEAVRRGGDWPSISDELRQQAFIGWWDEMTITSGIFLSPEPHLLLDSLMQSRNGYRQRQRLCSRRFSANGGHVVAHVELGPFAAVSRLGSRRLLTTRLPPALTVFAPESAAQGPRRQPLDVM